MSVENEAVVPFKIVQKLLCHVILNSHYEVLCKLHHQIVLFLNLKFIKNQKILIRNIMQDPHTCLLLYHLSEV